MVTRGPYRQLLVGNERENQKAASQKLKQVHRTSGCGLWPFESLHSLVTAQMPTRKFFYMPVIDTIRGGHWG